MKFELQQNCWTSFEPVVIDLPEDWEVEYHGLEADRWTPLTKEEIQEKLRHPLNMAPLSELAKPDDEAVIVFDDITRGTPVQPIAEVVLEELHRAGLKREQIRFLCAGGLHSAHSSGEFACKLGKEIISTYDVFNHNPYENCVSLGTTSRGTEAKINREFMRCSLRIGIGAVSPHHFNGFGGGYKLLFPGIAHIDTTAQNHELSVGPLAEKKQNYVYNMGIFENEMREDIEEMGRMVGGNFFLIDCLYNTRLQAIELFAGDAAQVFHSGAEVSRRVHKTPAVRDKDIVIVNAHAKANEANIAAAFAETGLSEKGGDIVIVNCTKSGQMPHYLFGSFGSQMGGRMWGRLRREQTSLRRTIYLSPYCGYTDLRFFGDRSRIVQVSTWREALDLLRQDYGPGSKVSVIADGTLSYFEQE